MRILRINDLYIIKKYERDYRETQILDISIDGKFIRHSEGYYEWIPYDNFCDLIVADAGYMKKNIFGIWSIKRERRRE